MLFGKKLSLSILFLIVFALTISSIAQAKSVYVITNHTASKVAAYDIEGEQIEHQKDVENLEPHGSGAVGLALDPDSAMLFVTFEGSNIIEMVNTKTMISEENPVTVTGAYSLAGIAFDQSKQKLYVVERQDNRLYVYLWNASSKTLTLDGGTYKNLENIGTYPEGAYGIALDESSNRLYVTDVTNKVKYYDTTNWDYKSSIDIVVDSNERKAVGIAIDPTRNYLYTGAFAGPGGLHNFLVRTDINDINNLVFTEHDVGAYVIGIAADQETGLVYVTTKKGDDDIEVYNTATFPSDPCYTETADIDQPADIVVHPPSFYLEKVDVNEPNCVVPDDYITYTISYGNPITDTCDPRYIGDVNDVVITDYLPDDLAFISASGPNMTYDPYAHTVTWQIGSLDAGEPNDSVTLTVKVNECILGCGIITNLCKIKSGDLPSRWACENTPVCSASNPEPTCGAITITASFKKFLVFSDFYEFGDKLSEHLSGLAHLISSTVLNKTGNYDIIL